MNTLESLRRHSIIVADTGDFLQVKRFAPQDATTNPTLILKAAASAAHADLVRDTIAAHAGLAPSAVVDGLLVRFGTELLGHVPGRVSTEVDPSLSFDTWGTLARALELVALYEAAGHSRERILVKVAATWEGIQAARLLERRGVHCNLTLVFSLEQAVACADAGVTLISPFVGRTTDWYERNRPPVIGGMLDPGVQLVARIHRWFRRHGVRTQVMAASFRRIDQIAALAGCDLITISPALLAQLQAADRPIAFTIDDIDVADELRESKASEEKMFRLALNNDAAACEKLAEGIRAFCAASDALLNRVAREVAVAR